MKYLPRATAFGKLKALAEGAAIVRKELAKSPWERATPVRAKSPMPHETRVWSRATRPT